MNVALTTLQEVVFKEEKYIKNSALEELRKLNRVPAEEIILYFVSIIDSDGQLIICGNIEDELLISEWGDCNSRGRGVLELLLSEHIGNTRVHFADDILIRFYCCYEWPYFEQSLLCDSKN